MMKIVLFVCLWVTAVTGQGGFGAGGGGSSMPGDRRSLLSSLGGTTGSTSMGAGGSYGQRSSFMSNPLLAYMAMGNDNMWPLLFMGGGSGRNGGGMNSMAPWLMFSMFN
ncbi:uncharacterized protein LOC121383394 [Gigantopelta aegis]|uniref:uncharacterized protein LOC121383394 n=1 Tax=Gigantopelta aegis TaxID=1735272 RepID=UPI001B88DA21|nr:uncharacterized protein LOC121383394 [Gigantopelta aegis]